MLMDLTKSHTLLEELRVVISLGPCGHQDRELVVLGGGKRYGNWESRKVVTTLRPKAHGKHSVNSKDVGKKSSDINSSKAT